jgi:uncharacterized protein involved in type VI secretion and phage assembly
MGGSVMEDLLVGQARDAASRLFGKYRGIVTDADDPEARGRIKAKVDALQGNETDWALPVVPFAGSGHGLVLIPEPGDGVWIEFEAGDTNRPLWTGGWWASGAMPSDGGKKKRALVTSNGHKLVLDEDGSIVQLKHSGGGEITITDTDITIKIGAAQIVLSAAGVNINNGAFTVL